jgi:hypothetical protein
VSDLEENTGINGGVAVSPGGPSRDLAGVHGWLHVPD